MKTPYDILTPLWHSNTLTIAGAEWLGISDAQLDGFIGYHLPNLLRKDIVPDRRPLMTIYHARIQDTFEKIKMHIADFDTTRFDSILRKMQKRGFIHIVDDEIVKDMDMSTNQEL